MVGLKKHFQEERLYGMAKTSWIKVEESMSKEELLDILIEGIQLGQQPMIQTTLKLIGAIKPTLQAQLLLKILQKLLN